MMMQRSSIVALLGSILLLSSTNEGASARMMEEDRRLQYEKRGYKWPIKAFNPNTEGWNALMNDRLNQVSEIDDETERYKGYVTTLFPALVVSNLTEYGWAMTRISDDLLMQLQQGIKDGFNDKQEEGRTPIIEGNQAWWIERDDLMDLVEEELHAPLEEWCGTDLSLTKVYGLRLFRNSSSFRMHIDKKGSHSVGYVLHVASSDDTKPWPFFIEDFHGRTHEISLTPGDVIMFEAGKLMHGRPRVLNGSWYSNVVGHYHPSNEEWMSMDHQAEAQYVVPSHWDQPAPAQKKFAPLEFRGGLKEPGCVDGWCRSDTKTTVKWSGPAKYGSYLDPIGDQHKFHDRKNDVSMEL